MSDITMSQAHETLQHASDAMIMHKLVRARTQGALIGPVSRENGWFHPQAMENVMEALSSENDLEEEASRREREEWDALSEEY